MSSRAALAQVLAGCLLWGTTGTAAALGALDAPAAVGAARLLGGSAVLAVLLAVRGRAGELRAVLGPGRRGLVVLAGLAAGGYQIAFFSAVAATGVTLGTVVALGVAPVATGICARLLLGERLGRRWAGATALAVTGCTVMVLGASGGQGTGGAALAGIVAAVAAGACYGLYTTAAKALLDDDLAPLPVLTATLGLGAVLTLPVLLAGGRALLVPAALPVLAWLCLAATAAAYASFAAGLRTLRAATVGTLALAEPLLATALGLAVLAERPAPAALIGAAILLVGLILVAAPTPRPHRGAVAVSTTEGIRPWGVGRIDRQLCPPGQVEPGRQGGTYEAICWCVPGGGGAAPASPSRWAISVQIASRDRPSTPAIAAIVGKAGVGTRPVSILRRVSGETRASSATSSIERLPLALRSTAPRRRPRSTSSGVDGNLTMRPTIVP